MKNVRIREPKTGIFTGAAVDEDSAVGDGVID